MALKSSGASSGTAWILNHNGFLGTYIQVPSAGATVQFDLSAAGIISNGVLPNVTLSVAGTNKAFTVVAGGNRDYLVSVALPGDSSESASSTYLLRLQLDNQTSSATPSLSINSLHVAGATVVNSNTDAIALQAAQTYADKFRSGPGTITFVTPSGGHLGAGTSVRVKLISNAFNFAVAVYGNTTKDAFWIRAGSNGENLTPNTPEQTKYQQAVLTNFNTIVPSNGGKWVNNELVPGSPDMKLVDAETQFAAQNGLRMRMHNLIWHEQQPKFIYTMFDPKGRFTGSLTTLNSQITSRISYYLSESNSQTLGIPRARNYIELDVLNEPFHGQRALRGDIANYIGSSALGVSGVANVYKQVADAVKTAGASTRLYTNEYSVLGSSPASISDTGISSGSDPYANWYLNGVQELQRAGAPIDGIGMEMYMNATSASAARMQQAMGNFSVAKTPGGKPIALTLSEFGVAAGKTPPPERYAADLRTALTMVYGNPQATTFGFWGGLGGPHFAGKTSPYALYDTDYNLTSAGTTWQNWMAPYNTSLTITTDAQGNVSFNGTYGTYQITADGQDYKLDLAPGVLNYKVMTRSPLDSGRKLEHQ